MILFQQSQKRFYLEEIQRLSKPTPSATPPATPPMKKDSQLRLVHPMLGDQGLLLVGGRLERSSLSSLQKHPVILSNKDYLTRLLFQYHHKRLQHCGPTLLLAQVGQIVFVPGAKRLAKEVCQGCLLCKRMAPKCHQQRMGQLPPPRIEISMCFVHTGVDYAGPFLLKTGHPRRPIPIKGYLAVFVCLATKGIHLEVVSSKSTPAFLVTLKRFITPPAICTQTMAPILWGPETNYMSYFNFYHFLQHKMPPRTSFWKTGCSGILSQIGPPILGASGKQG